MTVAPTRNGKRTVFLLALFWGYLATLGSLAITVDPNVSFVIVVSLLIAILLVSSNTKLGLQRRPEFGISSVMVVMPIIATQIIAGCAASFDFKNNLPLFTLILICFVCIVNMDFELVLRGFYFAAITLAVIGWPTELLGLNSFHYASGYGYNPLGWRWMGLQSHPNIAGITMAILFGLALLKYRNIPVALLSLTNIFFAEHRGGLIGVGLLLAFFTITNFSHWASGKRLAATLFWIAVALVAPFGLVARVGTDDISTGRVVIWGICEREFQSSPLFGSGPNALTRFFGLDVYSSVTPFHCHNQLLDDFVNFGWIGGLLPTVALLLSLTLSLVRKNVTHVILGIPLLACWFIESPFRLFATQPAALIDVFALFVLGSSLGWGMSKRSRFTSTPVLVSGLP